MLENNQENKLVMLKDLGMQFANESSKSKKHYAEYKCYCGNVFTARTDAILGKVTISCGCYKKIKSIKHGFRKHRLYSVWQQLVQRCTNPKHKRYKDYGARGITVCNEWLNIENFINDMDFTYIDGLSIDRIDNNKGYSFDNCRWVSSNIQSRNTRKLKSTNKSGYRGVYLKKGTKKWYSSIAVNYEKIFLGSYNTPIEAAKAYDSYVISNKLEHTINGVSI